MNTVETICLTVLILGWTALWGVVVACYTVWKVACKALKKIVKVTWDHSGEVDVCE